MTMPRLPRFLSPSLWSLLVMVLGVLVTQIATTTPGFAGRGSSHISGPDVFVARSDNVRWLGGVQFDGGTSIAVAGDHVYASEIDGAPEYPSRGSKPGEGGLHVIDVSGDRPVAQAFLHCPGYDNDLAMISRTLVAVGHANNMCNPDAHDSAGAGLFVVDASAPRRPEIVARLTEVRYAHSITKFPGASYIWVSKARSEHWPMDTSGGLTVLGEDGGFEAIIDVTMPDRPKIVQAWSAKCNDVSFHFKGDAKLAFCSADQYTLIWDASARPGTRPTEIASIINPATQFQSTSIASPDGALLAIADEGTLLHECESSQSLTGNVWIYDISDPSQPQLLTSFAAPRGGDESGLGTFSGGPTSWCSPQGLAWQPGSRNLAVAWATGGWSVYDLSNPSALREVAYARRENANVHSLAWQGKRLFTNDLRHGMDAFEIRALPE